jgi:hypothetical protein
VKTIAPVEYPPALAVFSKPVRFAEWKVLQVNSPTPPGVVVAEDWIPFGEEDKASAWKEIQGERWIYVFRRPNGKTDRPDWVDELHVTSDGKKGSASYKVAAVPMWPVAPDTAKEGIRARDQRKASPLTDNPRFARRVLGAPQDHFFFATRIQLHPESILELQKSVASWVTPILFEGDAHVLDPDADDVILPIVDPLTILVNLHGCYQKALKDYSDYVVPADDASDSETKRVASRMSKVLLARTLLDYLDRARNPALPKADDATYSEFVKALKGESAAHIDSFLRAYDAQIAYRVQWLDDLNRYLANWFRAGPVLFVGKAHLVTALDDIDTFLVPWLSCLEDAIHWRETRKVLDALTADKAPSQFPWFHQYVLPSTHISGSVSKAVRKSGSFAAKALKEVIPAWVVRRQVGLVLNDPTITKAFDQLISHVNMRFPNAEFKIVNAPRITYSSSIKPPPGYTEPPPMTWVVIRRKEAGTHPVPAGEPDPSSVSEPKFKKDAEAKGKATKKLGEHLDKLLKWINLGITVVTVYDDYKEAHDFRQRAVVVSGAVAKLVDVAGLYVKAAGHETFAKGISGVTSLVEMLGAASSLYDDLKKGKGRMAVAGDSLVLLGAGLQSTAYWSQVAKALAKKAATAVETDEYAAAAEMLAGRFAAIAAASTLIVIGSFLVMAGYIIKIFLTTSDLEYFAKRCAWGKDSDSDSDAHPWFSRVPYKQWKGQYDVQLEAFVNLLANPSVEGETWKAFAEADYLSVRTAYASIGWLPNEATMDVGYVEGADSPHPFTTSDDDVPVPAPHSIGKKKQIAAELVSPGRYRLYPTNVPPHQPRPDKVKYRVLWTLKIEGVELIVPASADARSDAWTKTFPPEMP